METLDNILSANLRMMFSKTPFSPDSHLSMAFHLGRGHYCTICLCQERILVTSVNNVRGSVAQNVDYTVQLSAYLSLLSTQTVEFSGILISTSFVLVSFPPLPPPPFSQLSSDGKAKNINTKISQTVTLQPLTWRQVRKRGQQSGLKDEGCRAKPSTPLSCVWVKMEQPSSLSQILIPQN